MPALKSMSQKALIAVSLLVWFVPSCFLLFQLAKNGTTVTQSVLCLPTMYGFTVAVWLRWVCKVLFEQQWFRWAFAAIISISLPTALVLLVLRAPRWRPMLLVIGLLGSCALTAAAYCLLTA